MEVKLFIEEQKAEGISMPDEWLEQAKALGLKGQVSLVKRPEGMESPEAADIVRRYFQKAPVIK